MGDLIAVLAPRAPLPLDGGGAIRINRLVRGLSREFETIFLTPAQGWGSADYSVAELEESLGGVEVIVVGTRAGADGSAAHGSRWRQARRNARPTATRRDPRARHLPDATRTLRALVERRGVRLIQYEFPEAAHRGPVPGAINVVSAHNVEHRIERALARRQSRPLARCSSEVSWRWLRHREIAAWRRMDLCLAVSALDAQTMRGAGASRVFEVPNGTDEVTRLAPPAGPDASPLRALFVGMGEWEPYERGLAWFITEVLPRVRAEHPLVFDVVGRPPRRRVRAEGVNYLGTVEDLSEHYGRCDVVVVPVFEGSGTRLKVIEAMAYGRPVVSTRLGAEGLPLRAGEHFLAADEPDAFSAALLRAGRGSRSREPEIETMLVDAAAAVRPLSWPAIAARLADLYREELASAAPPTVAWAM